MIDLGTRGEIFRKFLEENNFFIDYNGVHYTLIKENKAIHVSNTDDEMFNFILGFDMANKQNEETILNLTEQNRINVERYEKIIADYEGAD